MSNKQSGGTRYKSSHGNAGSGGGNDVMDLAKNEYYEYTHGGNIDGERSGKYEYMDILFEKNRLKNNVTLYRGGSEEEIDSMVKQAGAKSYYGLEGKEFVNKQYRSTSGQETDAVNYADSNVEFHVNYDDAEVADYSGSRDDLIQSLPRKHRPAVFVFHAHKGAKVIKRSDFTDTSGFGAGDEYTIGRGSKFKIRECTEDRYDDGMGDGYYMKTIHIDVY